MEFDCKIINVDQSYSLLNQGIWDGTLSKVYAGPGEKQMEVCVDRLVDWIASEVLRGTTWERVL